MDIAGYIKELILKNECVILAQFGGFVTKYRPANIDSERKILTPPSKEIEFRSDLKKDNGVLVNYIARKKRIFSTRARRLVEDYVQEIKAKLDRGENVVFQGLGTFVKDSSDQEIKFISLKDENYLIDSYGLMDLELSELGKSGNIDNIEYQIPPVKIINRKKTGFWVASSIVILIILLILIIPLTDLNYLANVNFNIKSADKADSLKIKKNEKIVFGKRRIINQDSVKNIEQVIDDATRKEVALFYSEPEVKKDEEEELINPPDKYYLIAGSFKRLENAERLKTTLINDGYNPQIIQTENGYFRVTLSSFDSRNIAIRELQRIRKGLNRAVWILGI